MSNHNPEGLADQRFHMAVQSHWLERLDNWCISQPGIPSRSQAVRDLVNQSLDMWDQKKTNGAEINVAHSNSEDLERCALMNAGSTATKKAVIAPSDQGEGLTKILLKYLKSSSAGLRPGSAKRLLETRYSLVLGPTTVRNELNRLRKLGIVRCHQQVFFYVPQPGETNGSAPDSTNARA